MFEMLLLLIVCFVAIIFFLPFLVICIYAFVGLLKSNGQVSTGETHNSEEQPIDDSKEDSEADLAMTSDDENSWMFPPEFDE
jgi:hypothetical protein